MLKFIPEKSEKDEGVKDDKSSNVEEEDGSRKKKKMKKKSTGFDPLPSQVVAAIHNVYCAKHNKTAHVSHIFLGMVRELTITPRFAVLAIMELGQKLVDYYCALKEKKDARVLVECGSYEGPSLMRKVCSST
ncbi:hypothetical protein R1sor_010085 [Riccia sorocarpa]|uniref:Uncharacterized protein n=1 Tax=Riccia sorocarpa TaxID=122646 RepID=A0ABD3HYY6_9MARC